MECVTLECSFDKDAFDWIFERCKQHGLVPSEYLTNLVLRDKRQQKEIDENYRQGSIVLRRKSNEKESEGS